MLQACVLACTRTRTHTRTHMRCLYREFTPLWVLLRQESRKLNQAALALLAHYT
jgi:hypothetical protein